MGGIKQGRTQRPGESQRWMASLPIVSQIAGNFSSDIVGLSPHSRLSKHLDGPQVTKHENFVKNVLAIFDTEMFDDPFSGHTDLVNICSGEVAPAEVLRSYKECGRIGSAAENKIVSERWLLSPDGRQNIALDAPIPKTKNNTWNKRNLPKSRLRNAESGKVESSAIAKVPLEDQFAKSIFLALLLMSEEQSLTSTLTKRELMSFPLCTYPASISLPTGVFYQTDKAGLRQSLIAHPGGNADVEFTPDELDEIWTARSGVYIIDAMAVVTPMACMGKNSASPRTFLEFAKQVLRRMVIAAREHRCVTLHIVPDTYKPGSTKVLEHQARTGNLSINRMRILRAPGIQQNLPKSQKEMKSFMACDDNKNDLIEYLFEIASMEAIYNDLNRLHGSPGGLVIFFAHGGRCHRISRDGFPLVTFRVDEVPDLASDHGEADGRLILHSLFAARELPRSSGPSVATSRRIIIESEDTDNLVIAICHSRAIASALRASLEDAIATFCMFLGTRKLLVDIFAIACKLGPDLSAALPGFHAVTGCDTTSYFKWVGKKVPWDVFLEGKQIFTSALTTLGSTREPLSQDVMADLEAFVCRFYQSSATSPGQVVSNANELRERLFDPKMNLATDEKLPPTRDCLQCHFQRAHFQALQWRLSNIPVMNLPDVSRFGFRRCNEGHLSVIWYTGNMLPQALHTPVSCSCKKSQCKTGVCSCRKLNLLCNSSCKCEGCENCHALPEDQAEIMSEEEEEEENDEVAQGDLDSDDDDDVQF